MTEYQTRSEENGIVLHETLEEAMGAAMSDRTIWKISYSTPSRRIRLVRIGESNLFAEEPMPDFSDLLKSNGRA